MLKEYDMKEENSYKREDNHMFQESRDTVSEYLLDPYHSYTLNDPTDVISYDNPNHNNIVYAAPTLRNNSCSTTAIVNMTENLQANTFRKPFEEIPHHKVDQLGSSFNEEFLKQTLLLPNMAFNEEPLHRQVPNFESAFENREKSQRYEELVRMKNALEFFYTKTLQEMTLFEKEASNVSNMTAHQ